MNFSFRSARLLTALLLPLAGACSDGGPTGGADRGLRIVVSGLPGGAAAAITVTGPDSYSRMVTGTEELTDLRDGSYVVTAADVEVEGDRYGALEPSQEVVVSGGGVQSASVVYANSISGLAVRIRGLPAGSSPTVRVTGPNDFAEELTTSRLLPGLEPGTYTVIGSGVAAGDSTYQAKPVLQEVVVSGGGAASVDVSYQAVAQRAFNVRIETMYLVQGIQTREGAVPLVAGRDAYVRVFALGNQANTAMPLVRVQLYAGSELTANYLLPATGSSVVSAVNQGSISTSWNVKIPGDMIQPGLRMLAEVDAGNGVVEADEQDNHFPVSGTPQSIAVHVVPPLRITMVPVHQSSNGRTGNLTAANVESYLSLARKLHPIGDVRLELREPYTTLASPFDRAGNVWASVVSELDAVRVAEASAQDYYFGVVDPPYEGGGVVGIASGIPSRTALGWDRFPDAPETLAHELGHNFGRYHAPCGGAGGSDAEYPYALGLIGGYGMDVETGEIKGPSAYTDIMGYCETSWWISDYTFRNVLRYRLDNDVAPQQTSEPTLLVWGRMSPEGMVLEPAFRMNGRSLVPREGGTYRLEGFDNSGVLLFSYSFEGSPVSDGPEGTRTFAFALPLDASRSDRLATLRLSGAGRATTVHASEQAAAQPRGPIAAFQRTEVRRENGGTISVRWDDDIHRMVMIRDPNSGRILSFARGGEVRVSSGAGELDLVYSDGVRSVTSRVLVDR